MSSSRMWDLDGAVVAGRYRLSGVLGRGGMADVYRARDSVLDRDVAVKMLRQPSTAGPERDRFVAEARILAGLSHPGLVAVLDAGPDAGLDPQSETEDAGPERRSSSAASSAAPGSDADWSRPFVVMELVEGRSLAEAILAGPLPAAQVLQVGVRVAEALAYIHARDVVHRDVKPGNILLGDVPPGDEPRIKLADFGIARLLGDTARYTRTGQMIGTVAYLSPEQVTGNSVTGATDIYALGLVLLEAITGRREFTGPATEAALARLHRTPQIPADLSWRELLENMTAGDPADRPTGREVTDRLRNLPAGLAPVAVDQAVTRRLVTGTAANTSSSPLTISDASQPDEAPATRVDTHAGAAPNVAATRLLETAAVSQPTAVSRRPLHNGRRGTLALLVVIAVLVAALGAAGLISHQRSDTSSIPPNTPAKLREPLQRLHDAVDGK